ncbi:MAG TPA: hypothetical protein VE344_10835 [Methylomirabilota bacterium]|nr:hypothetical protein [Methylomirabilota bacterium]
MSILSVIKAPVAVQLYRCLFTLSLIYFGSFLRLLHHGSPVSGILVIAGFPFFSLVGLIAACLPIRFSRWIMAILGVLIPSVAFGGLFFAALPDQGWFDTAGGVLIWCAIIGVPISWAFMLFRDKKTCEYFGGLAA